MGWGRGRSRARHLLTSTVSGCRCPARGEKGGWGHGAFWDAALGVLGGTHLPICDLAEEGGTLWAPRGQVAPAAAKQSGAFILPGPLLILFFGRAGLVSVP